MSKKLNNLIWETVALEGFPASVTNKLDGFVGLEECTDYGLEKESKKPKKKKAQNKRKNSSESLEKEVPNKKVKLSSGFIVENVNSASPSITTEEIGGKRKKKKKNKAKKILTNTLQNTETVKVSSKKKSKPKLGEDISQTVCDLTPEDMLSWAEFKLPEPILKALAELGFKKPTKIQELSLPAAIHGRRDILGAAETGSGKTLAFGLPILSGILKIKEKVDKGFDPYDIHFKKSSNKKKQHKNDQNNKVDSKNKKNKYERNNKKEESKLKESSEDGYSSGESEDEEKQNVIEEKPTKKVNQIKTKNAKTKDEFIEEYDVPLRKKPLSLDEKNDSDDSENYIHLSDMLDSEDQADSSDDEKVDESEGDEKSGEKVEVSDGEISGEEAEEDSGENSELTEEESESDDEDDGGSDDEIIEKAEDGSDGETIEDNEEGLDEDMIEDDADENEQGIGCVKVIDNIEIPGPTSTKTGKPLYALIVTPTRELAMQISQHLKAVAKYTGIRIATIVGGMAAVKQERVLRAGPEVVVATPGRLWELLGQGTPHLQQMEYVKFLAIDETDRMLERAHFEELTPLLERLNANEAQAASRQNFVFSATLTMVHDLPTHMMGKKVTKRGKILNRKVQKMTPQQKINKLINSIGMTEPKVVDITQLNSGTADSLTECRITCAFEQKDAYLYYILKRHPGRTIVFCNAIGCVKRLAQLLSILKCHPLPLHASMQQRQRLKNLERFRDDPRGVLVATDVAARGLDIPGVDHVIHYQVPKTAENYVHRSGRTARATKEGLTILMMEPAEGYLYSKMCRTLNKTSEVPLFPVPAASISPFKDIVNIARDIDALELKKRRATQAAGWRDKAAREMDMILDDDDVPVAKVDASIEKALKAKKHQLDKLLSRPMFPKGFSYKYPSLNDPSALTWSDENALQVMKKALQSGELKKEKRKSKNAPFLQLQKDLKKLK